MSDKTINFKELREEKGTSYREAVKEAVKFKKEHIGSSFDSFLDEEGILDEVQATSLKRVIAFQIAEEMALKKLSKVEMARRMKTSRSQLDRVLDPKIDTIQLDLIVRAAHSIGRSFQLALS